MGIKSDDIVHLSGINAPSGIEVDNIIIFTSIDLFQHAQDPRTVVGGIFSQNIQFK
jgi:hypothetical protein